MTVDSFRPVAEELEVRTLLSFYPAVNYPAGVAAHAIGVGDFNSDTKMDIVVADKTNPGTVNFLAGRGDGTFIAGVAFAVNAQPVSVGVADFNTDGKLDVVTVNQSPNSVCLLFGNGDGTFQAQSSFALTISPAAVAVGDFNNDQKQDLAIGNNNNPGSASILLSNGDGTFASPATFATGNLPSGIVAADFNKDGFLDFATSNSSSNTTSIVLGNGDGKFKTQRTFATDPAPSAIVAGDFNNDLRLDLAITSNQTKGSVNVLIGNGDGTFLPRNTFPDGKQPNAVVAVDFDGDGRLDIATTSQTAGAGVSLLLGNGDGFFKPQTVFGAGSAPFGLGVGAFVREGYPDLVVANEGSNNVSVLLNKSAMPEPNATVAPTLGSLAFPAQTTVGDFNRDGKADFALTNRNGFGSVAVYLGNGNGTFQTLTPMSAGSGPYGVINGDFNLDGKPDIAFASAGSNSVNVLLGNGDGQFQSELATGVQNAPVALVAGDFNRDGKLDIAVANYYSNTVSILLGNGNGTFKTASTFIETTFATGAGPFGIAAGDLNHDGILDLTTANSGSATVSVLIGNGNGTFRPQVGYSIVYFLIPGIPTAVTMGEFTGDGNLDVAVTDQFYARVNFFPGKGNGTLLGPSIFNTGGAESAIESVDFNLDGKLDLAVANQDAIGFDSVLLGYGDGTFQAAKSFTIGKYPSSVSVGDFNGDGAPDLVSTNLGGSSASVLINQPLQRPAIGFGNARNNAAGQGPASVVTADFTADGVMDLAAANQNDGTLSVYIGNRDTSFQNQLTSNIGTSPKMLVLGDFNGDSKTDIAAAYSGGVNILLSDGDGTFSSTIINSPAPNAITFADVNNDYNLDLISLSSADKLGAVYLGNGNGTFVAPITFGTTAIPNALNVGDFNRDGLLDLVVANSGSTGNIFLGNGNGSFRNALTLTTLQNPNSAAVGDFNGDGKLDFSLANPAGNSISVYLGNGDGKFATQPTFATGPTPNSISTVDFDRDGKLDLAVAHSNTTFGTFRGNGNGTFQAMATSTAGSQPASLAIGDFNRDGSPDVATANFGSNNVSTLLAHDVPDLFSFAVPSSVAINVQFAFTVTAQVLGATDVSFRGTIHFTSSDPLAVLPADYTYTLTDQGSKTFLITLNTLGAQTITATDTVSKASSTSSPINVTPGPVTQYGIAAPASSSTGAPFSITVSALDSKGNVNPTYAGRIHFTSTDVSTGVQLPADYTFTTADQGVHTFTNAVKLVTLGNQTIRGNDTGFVNIIGTAVVNVTPTQASQLAVTMPSSAIKNVPFTVTIAAVDPFGVVDQGYRGTVTFSSDDKGVGVVLPANYTFTAGDKGQHTFTNGATLVTVGSRTVTATDTKNSTITGTGSINITQSSATQFTVGLPATSVAGSPFSAVITALDSKSQVDVNYTGTIHFTSTDAATGVVLPADYTFTTGDNGVHTFTNGLTLVTAANQTVTVTDVLFSSINGNSKIQITPSTAAKLGVQLPATIPAGSPFDVRVTARDSFNNVVSGYLGTVDFSSSDTGKGIVLPPSYTFTAADSGTHLFANGATLATQGSQTITATDKATASITGNAAVNVTQSLATRFAVVVPTKGFETMPFSFAITALDSFGQTATNYTGTVHFTTTDTASGVVLPPDFTFTALDQGVKTFANGATLVTLGNQSIIATDTKQSSITGTATLSIVAAPAIRFAVSAPSRTVVGIPFSATVTALNKFGQVDPNYIGTVHFISSDNSSGIALPADYTFTAADKGVRTFSNAFTLRTLGSQFVTAFDRANASIAGTVQTTVANTAANASITVTGTDAGGGPNVMVFDARTNAVKFNFFAYDTAFTGGVRVAVGDFNFDGVPDIVTAPGPGGGPDIHIYDGSTGKLIRQFFAYDPLFSGGVYVAAGDVNGDGIADVVCGADAGGGPNITVFSGADASRLHSFFAYDSAFTGGVRVAAGDVNGDGRSDIITGAGAGGGPHVTVFSGADASILHSFFAYDIRFNSGIYVAAGDTNGDGKADIITGAGSGGGPNVSVFNGINGAVLHSIFAFDRAFTGGVRVSSVDPLGDGRINILTAAGPGGGPSVASFNGLTPIQVDSFFAYNPLFHGGLFVAGNAR